MLTEQLSSNETPQMREVVVYSTAGGEERTLTTDATTWEQLTAAFRENNISWSGMRVVEGNTEVTYFDPNITVRPDQKLPTEYERLVFFMAPVKVKSGLNIDTLPYWDCRSLIHNLISVNEGASDHFNVHRNYTNKSTEELRDLLRTWYDNDDTNCLANLAPDASNIEKINACIRCLEEIEGTEDVISVLNSLDFQIITRGGDMETQDVPVPVVNLAEAFFRNDPQVVKSYHDIHESLEGEFYDDEYEDY